MQPWTSKLVAAATPRLLARALQCEHLQCWHQRKTSSSLMVPSYEVSTVICRGLEALVSGEASHVEG